MTTNFRKFANLAAFILRTPTFGRKLRRGRWRKVIFQQQQRGHFEAYSESYYTDERLHAIHHLAALSYNVIHHS